VYYDEVDPYSGNEKDFTVEVSLQPTARFNESVSWSRVVFDRASDGTNVYTVDVLNTRTTFQINRELALRAIVQYDSSKHRCSRTSWPRGSCGPAPSLRGVRARSSRARLERSAVHRTTLPGPTAPRSALLLQGLLHPPLSDRKAALPHRPQLRRERDDGVRGREPGPRVYDVFSV
jgi:hypothetical protein